MDGGVAVKCTDYGNRQGPDGPYRQRTFFFDSMSEFVDAGAPHVRALGSWTGNLSKAETIHAAHSGMDSFTRDLTLPEGMIFPTSEGRRTRRAVAGGRVHMGAYLADSPLCFRTRQRDTFAGAPLKIGVNITSQESCDSDQIAARGRAIVGLLSAIQMQRPVDLYLLIDLGTPGRKAGTSLSIRVDSRPISLAQVGFALCHPAFARGLGYSYLYTQGHVGGYFHPQTLEGGGLFRFEFAETDAYFGPILQRDSQAWLDPQAWIASEYARIMGVQQ